MEKTLAVSWKVDSRTMRKKTSPRPTSGIAPHVFGSVRRNFTSVSKSKKMVVTVKEEERAERDRLAIARALLFGELMRMEHWRMLPLKRKESEKEREEGRG